MVLPKARKLQIVAQELRQFAKDEASAAEAEEAVHDGGIGCCSGNQSQFQVR